MGKEKNCGGGGGPDKFPAMFMDKTHRGTGGKVSILQKPVKDC